MKRLRQWEILLANMAWLFACLPGALAFLCATVFPRLTQRRLLRRMLRRARDTQFGRQHGFDRILNGTDDFQSLLITSYETLQPFLAAIQAGKPNVLTSDAVTVLQPTSGTSADPKMIPFTAGLQRQFQAALAPWIASLYLLRPQLLRGRQYWCLSPNTRPVQTGNSAVSVGFADDTEYLGTWQRWFARWLLVAPPELARVEDPATFEFLTLLFLVGERNLRLISVWHPSFLTLLLDALLGQAERLADCLRTGELPGDLVLSVETQAAFVARLMPDPERAADVASVASVGSNDLRQLWPHMQVISCWAGRDAEPSLKRLRAAFPGVTIQSKGLLATEGVVSIPWGFSGRHLAAVRSHFLEFIETQTGQTKHVWELQPGLTYSVVLTTAGGLCRYHLKDRVRVSGFWAGIPYLEFLGREGLVSDICGEKLTGNDFEAALESLNKVTGVAFDFAMLVPDWSELGPGYVFIFETKNTTPFPSVEICGEFLERSLLRNFHYEHARRLGQLHPLRLLFVRNAASVYRAELVRRGLQLGGVKFPALRKEFDWVKVFKDDHVEAAASLA